LNDKVKQCAERYPSLGIGKNRFQSSPNPDGQNLKGPKSGTNYLGKTNGDGKQLDDNLSTMWGSAGKGDIPVMFTNGRLGGTDKGAAAGHTRLPGASGNGGGIAVDLAQANSSVLAHELGHYSQNRGNEMHNEKDPNDLMATYSGGSGIPDKCWCENIAKTLK
jgi:hypothetical protein